MASNIIETPGIPSGNEQEKLEQMYRYLCRLADDLNVNLQAIGGNDLTDDERQVMQQILVKSAEDAGVQPESVSGQMLQMESLKSLIIKTAQFVQTQLDEYKLNLLRETVADGQFGKYLKRTKLDVDVTPEGIQQNYSLQETVEGLMKADINARSYIKTGYLHDDENHLPVYGVAIGKEIVDFQVDGSVVYNDGNKVAELTADELSFWYNNTKVFYIKTGKIYTAGDFEILSGGKLKINAGGTFDVDTANFKISSANKSLIAGNWKLSDAGIEYGTGDGFGVVANGNEIIFTNNFLMQGKKGFILDAGGRIIPYTQTGVGAPWIGSSTDKWEEGFFSYVNYDYLVQNSSRAVKHNIQPMKPPGERLDQLRPVTFIYNDDRDERTRQGLIWEDAVQVMPEICTDGDKEGKAINYVELIPMLLAEVQQLRARVSEIERRQDNGKETKQDE